jgi:hypothetical protein
MLNKNTRYGLTRQDGTAVTPAYPDSGDIVTTAPGRAGNKLLDATQQSATDLVAGIDGRTPNNFLDVTSGKGLIPTVNPAQAASEGKSLAPEHE